MVAICSSADLCAPKQILLTDPRSHFSLGEKVPRRVEDAPPARWRGHKSWPHVLSPGGEGLIAYSPSIDPARMGLSASAAMISATMASWGRSWLSTVMSALA